MGPNAEDFIKMRNGIMIRDFRKSDVEELLRLLSMCFDEWFEFTGFDPDHARSLVNRVYGGTGRLVLGLLRLFRKEPLKFLVAEVDGNIVGTTMVNDMGKAGYISAVMVHPDYRRKGVATRLMLTALGYLRKKKKVRAILDVVSTNTPARDMYIKLGFNVFEHTLCLSGETDSLCMSEDSDVLQIRPFQKDDLDAVYNLVVASEDPTRLRIYGFDKNRLKNHLLQRLFPVSTKKKIVAVSNGRVVGYAEATYTTPEEVGSIGSIHVNPESRASEVEKRLISAASSEIRKGGITRIRTTIPVTRQGLMETLKNLGLRENFAIDGMVEELPPS